MSQHSIRNSRGGRAGRSVGTLAAFVLGIGLTVGFYVAVDRYAPKDSLLVRYCCAHPIEYVEVGMFFWGLCALLGKWLHGLWQRGALRRVLLPAWDGKPAPVVEAGKLLDALAALPRRLGNSLLGRRLHGGLDFVASRGSTDGLDDHLRSLSDADADAMDGSHSLIRFITWAIPILGFLGTVLGITEAIANVTPEELNTSISSVTSGLALAFDATALALAFSMCLMFLTFLVDRGEQGLLQAVDQIVEQQLAHRFERLGSEKSEFVVALKKNTQVLLQSSEKLVERQADIWQKSLGEMRAHLERTEGQQRDRFTGALSEMMEQTVQAHQERLLKMEEQAAEHVNLMGRRFEQHAHGVADQFEKLSGVVRDLTAGLERQSTRLADQVAALRQVMEAEGQLADLQETLNRNLQSLAHAGTLQQAVHSLTAAIHLLTANAELAAPGSHLRLRTPDARSQTAPPRQGNAA